MRGIERRTTLNKKVVRPTTCVLKTFDFQHRFSTYDPSQAGTCRIRIFEFFSSEDFTSEAFVPETLSARTARCKFPKITKTVIVASQDRHSAASVTNFAESIATEICLGHRKRRASLTLPSPSQNLALGQAANVLPQTVWIEHYPPGTLLTAKQERFSIVEFACRSDKTLFNPRWREVPRLHIEQSILKREFV